MFKITAYAAAAGPHAKLSPVAAAPTPPATAIRPSRARTDRRFLTLFNTSDQGLDEVVESCYREHLEYDRNRVWDGLPASFVVVEPDV